MRVLFPVSHKTRRGLLGNSSHNPDMPVPCKMKLCFVSYCARVTKLNLEVVGTSFAKKGAWSPEQKFEENET